MSAPQIDEHVRAYLRTNADTGIRKPRADFAQVPTDDLPVDPALPNTEITAFQCTAGLSTRLTSSDVWAGFSDLTTLFADPDRLAPRYRIEQLCGLETTQEGNEYRIALSDPAYRSAVQFACAELSGAASGLDIRRMDFRVERAGPWGAETAELILTPLVNHARAGLASVCVIAHPGDDPDGLMITIDCAEISRPAWLPDLMAGYPEYLFDWKAVLNRLSAYLDASPIAQKDYRETYWTAADMNALVQDPNTGTMIDMHPALAGIISTVEEHETK